jgi:hypothetical protein
MSFVRIDPLHPAARSCVDVEQSASVMLQSAYGISEIGINGADVAEHANVRGVACEMV